MLAASTWLETWRGLEVLEEEDGLRPRSLIYHTGVDSTAQVAAVMYVSMRLMRWRLCHSHFSLVILIEEALGTRGHWNRDVMCHGDALPSERLDAMVVCRDVGGMLLVGCELLLCGRRAARRRLMRGPELGPISRISDFS